MLMQRWIRNKNECVCASAGAPITPEQSRHNKNKALRPRQIKKTQDELQWIVAQRLLSALTIPGFS